MRLIFSLSAAGGEARRSTTVTEMGGVNSRLSASWLDGAKVKVCVVLDVGEGWLCLSLR